MIARVLGVVVALAAVADACPPNRPCKKNQPKRVEPIEPIGYVREVRGAVPTWDRDRIETFLVDSLWDPMLPGGKRWSPQRTKDSSMPTELEFVPTTRAEELANGGTARKVLVREIQRRRTVILVEIDGDPWRLDPCPRKRGYACLTPAANLPSGVKQ